MKITSINLAGTIARGKRLPRAFARIERNLGSDTIEITTMIGEPGPDEQAERTEAIAANSDNDLRSAARALQKDLDGVVGTKTDVHEYYQLLHQLTD